MLAHGTAVPIIRDVCPGAEVSITLNPTQVLGPQDPTAADLDAVRRADNNYNGVFYSPLFHGEYPNSMLEDVAHLTDGSFIHDGDLATISAPWTTSASTTTSRPGCGPATRGEPDAARGLRRRRGRGSAGRAHRHGLGQNPTPTARSCCGRHRSGLPVYITENGRPGPTP